MYPSELTNETMPMFFGSRDGLKPNSDFTTEEAERLIDGEPAELIERIEAFDGWLAASPEVPKLLMSFEGSPTLLITSEVAAWCTANIAGLETVPCGRAGHHAPEDQPLAIAAAISAWADRHGLH